MATPNNDLYSVQSGGTVYAGLITPILPPVADFIGAPTSGTTPLAVTFTNQSTGNISNYLWDFGDGQTSTSTNPTHVFNSAGTYNISLTATGPGGSNTKTRSSYVSATVLTPTTLTLSGSTTGTTGSPTTITATLDHPATTAVTVTPTAATGATFSTPAVIPIGQTTTTWTITRATDGTAVINATTSPSLTIAGSYIYTSSTVAPTGTPGVFTLSSPSSGTLPFSIGLAFRQGDIPSGQDVAFSGATAKATILSTWPDGSARFAFGAGTYSSSGSQVTITPSAGSNPAGTVMTGASIQSTMGSNTAVIDCGSYGTVTWSGADFASPFLTVCATSLHIKAIYRKSVGSDAHLVAWLEIDCWSNGAVEVLPWIENGYVNVASPSSKSATFGFTLGGTSRFSAAIDLSARCRTPLISGTVLSYWLSTDPAVTFKHDTVYLQQTNLVPSYQSITPDPSLYTSLPSTFSPLQQGMYRDVMSATGYHPSIGLLPQWDVLHLISPTAQTFGAVIRQAYSAGRYASHYRDENTNRPIRLSQRTTDTINTAAAATGTVAPVYDTGHHPSMGYLAYLLTGRFYFMEEVQFVATYNYLRMSADVVNQRQYAKGIFVSASGDCTVRGASWCNRTLAQASIVSSDGDLVGTDLKASLEENINWNHARYVAQTNNPYGLVEPYTSSYGQANGHQIEAPWQQDFYTAAFGFMLAAQPSISSTALTKLGQFFRWKAQWIVGRLQPALADSYLYSDAAQYNLEVCATGADFGTGAGPWPTSWGQMYGWNFVTSNTTDPGTLRGGNFPGAASYWGNLHPAAAYAAKLGVPLADQAWARLTAASNYTTLITDFTTAPEWAVVPFNTAALPYTIPAPGQTANISTNSYSTVCHPASWFTTFPNVSPWRNWSVGVHAPGYSEAGAMVYWGGGHNGGAQSDAVVFDLMTAKWKLVGPGQPATSYVGNLTDYTTGSLDATYGDYPYNGSYIVPAYHTYAYPVYMPPYFDGSGSKGQWVGPCQVIDVGQQFRPHSIDLATGSMQRWTSNAGNNDNQSGYAGSVIDYKRLKLWVAKASTQISNLINLNDSSPRAFTQVSVVNRRMGENSAYYPTYTYVPEADRFAEFSVPYASTTLQMAIYDTTTGNNIVHAGFVTLPTGGALTGVLDAGFGVDWCPITKKFYFFNSNGTNTVYTLAVSDPRNLATATYTWGSETFNNPAWVAGFNSGGGALAFGHWKYMPLLRCFVWAQPTYSAVCQDGQTHDGVFQLWRPAGT